MGAPHAMSELGEKENSSIDQHYNIRGFIQMLRLDCRSEAAAAPEERTGLPRSQFRAGQRTTRLAKVVRGATIKAESEIGKSKPRL